MVIDHKGVYVQSLGRVVTKHYLKYYQPTAVFNYLNKDEKKHKNPAKYDFVSVDVLESFREVNILRELVGWLKGESYFLAKIQKEIPFKLRTERQLEGWLKDHPESKARMDEAIEQDYELELAERAAKRKSARKNRRRMGNNEVAVLEEVENYG